MVCIRFSAFLCIGCLEVTPFSPGQQEGQVPYGDSAQSGGTYTYLGQRKRTANYVYHCPKSLGKPAANKHPEIPQASWSSQLQ